MSLDQSKIIQNLGSFVVINGWQKLTLNQHLSNFTCKWHYQCIWKVVDEI